MPAADRDTRQKKLILACLPDYCDSMFTADELEACLRERGTPVGKATVYRFLRRLESEGALERHSTPGGASARWRYTGNADCASHYHLMCTRCDAVIHTDSELLRAFVSHAREHENFVIDTHKTVFYGLCVGCVSKPEEK